MAGKEWLRDVAVAAVAVAVVVVVVVVLNGRFSDAKVSCE